MAGYQKGNHMQGSKHMLVDGQAPDRAARKTWRRPSLSRIAGRSAELAGASLPDSVEQLS